MAGSIRLFVNAALREGGEVGATPGQAHYLGAVMRCRSGDAVRLFNGREGEWQARIAELRRGTARLAVEHRLRPQAEEPDLWLAFALLKRFVTDLVVQKATELGASALLPLFTGRTGAERVNEARLAAIATEAAEQSERLTVPTLHPPQSFSDFLAGWPHGRVLLAAMERADAPPVPALQGRPAGLLIGPEGGFTEAELDALRRRPFVVPVSLGPRILRAETAAIVGLALMQAQPSFT
jgi:16S rRNA (uracil1498-N3)-methyltransferase